MNAVNAVNAGGKVNRARQRDENGCYLAETDSPDLARPATPRFFDLDLSFGTGAASYLAELVRRGRAPSTIELSRKRLASFHRFLSNLPSRPEALADITQENVTAFFDHELSRERKTKGGGPLSAATLSLTAMVLRGFFRHLVKRGFVLLDAARELEVPRKDRRLPRNVPTPRQVLLLISAPDTRCALGKRDRAALELLYSTGLRNAELCALTVSDVDLLSRTVYVRKGKGGKDRIVPLGREAVKALADYLGVYTQLLPQAPKKKRGPRPSRDGPGDAQSREVKPPAKPGDRPLFFTATGRALNGNGLRGLVAHQTRRAGLALPTTPHSLRHACATHLLRGGAGIRQIQVLLGHSSLSSTEIYTKVETTDLRAMLDRHHPRSAALHE